MKRGREPLGSKQREKWARELVKTDTADDLIRPWNPTQKEVRINQTLLCLRATYTRETR